MDKTSLDRNFMRALTKSYKSIRATPEIESFLRAAIDGVNQQPAFI